MDLRYCRDGAGFGLVCGKGRLYFVLNNRWFHVSLGKLRLGEQ